MSRVLFDVLGLLRLERSIDFQARLRLQCLRCADPVSRALPAHALPGMLPRPLTCLPVSVGRRLRRGGLAAAQPAGRAEPTGSGRSGRGAAPPRLGGAAQCGAARLGSAVAWLSGAAQWRGSAAQLQLRGARRSTAGDAMSGATLAGAGPCFDGGAPAAVGSRAGHVGGAGDAAAAAAACRSGSHARASGPVSLGL